MDLYKILNDLDIVYQKFDHPAVHTAEDSKKLKLNIPGASCKALFLTTEKKANYFLILCEGSKRLDLKKVQNQLQCDRLTFATPEELKQYLDITPGSVSPFVLINKSAKDVVVVIDKELLSKEQIGFHPNDNRATIVVSPKDLQKFIRAMGNEFLAFSC